MIKKNSFNTNTFLLCKFIEHKTKLVGVRMSLVRCGTYCLNHLKTISDTTSAMC